MLPNPPSNSRLPRLAGWSGYGTARWLQIGYFIGPYHPSTLKRNLIALHFDFVRVGKRPISDLQPFELQNLFTPNSHLMNFVRTSSPGHFQAPKNLTFKTRLQWCKTFLLKMSFTCMRINNHFDINRFSLCLTLEQRLKATRTWPIGYLSLSIDALQFATIRKYRSKSRFKDFYC